MRDRQEWRSRWGGQEAGRSQEREGVKQREREVVCVCGVCVWGGGCHALGGGGDVGASLSNAFDFT